MNEQTSQPIIRHMERETQLIYHPPRRSVHIAEGDWDRWIRSISRIPQRESLFRDVSLSSFGVAITSLATFIFLIATGSGAPDWPLFIYLGLGLVTLVTGIVCILFDKKIGKISKQSVADVLQDMNEVRERATMTEEKVLPTPPVTKIG